jgi:cardiolipin synthase
LEATLPTLTLADYFTLTRLVAVIPLLLFWWLPGGAWLAFAVLAVACLTDFADGIIARHRKEISPFGTMIDPIADKVLVISALLMLALSGILTLIGLVAFWIILWREIIVSGLREYLAQRGLSMPVTPMAKYKTAAQMLALSGLFFEHAWRGGNAGAWLWSEGGLLLATVLTVWTGIAYGKATIEALKG